MGALVNTQSTAETPIALFRIGRIVVTPNALESLSQSDILTGLRCHQAGDWGDVSDHDRQANDRAIEKGARVVSVYQSANRVKFWIITEADRRTTTVLLPQDY
jgi:hypothetical protein